MISFVRAYFNLNSMYFSKSFLVKEYLIYSKSRVGPLLSHMSYLFKNSAISEKLSFFSSTNLLAITSCSSRLSIGEKRELSFSCEEFS